MAKTLVFPSELFDKIVIGDECTPPLDASALLTLNSTTQGFLVPRLTTAQVNAISLPIEGLLVYNATEHTFWFYDGTVWTPIGTGAGGGSNEGSFPPSNQQFTGPSTSVLVAGENLTISTLVYLKSDGKWWKANATTDIASGGVVLGITAETKLANVLIKVALSDSIFREDSWSWTTGAVLYVGTTSGQITAVQPSQTDNVIRVIGHAFGVNLIYFTPSPDWVTHV